MTTAAYGLRRKLAYNVTGLLLLASKHRSVDGSWAGPCGSTCRTVLGVPGAQVSIKAQVIFDACWRRCEETYGDVSADPRVPLVASVFACVCI